jgi:hypothetical protein
MPGGERKHVGKGYTFPPEDTGTIRKGRGYRKDVFPAERAAGRFPGKRKGLIYTPFESLRTDPASKTGQVFLTVL